VLRSNVFSRLSTRLAGLKAVQTVADQAVLDHLLQHIGATAGPGQTLIGFLNEAARQNASIAVTGHSKGGALAVATALWLAENWAPQRQAEIECFSFAGPTAGNTAFAQRYNARLASRTRRIVNRLDIVPQAWVPANLATLQPAYPLLGPAIKLLTNSITPLGHAHVGGQLTEIGETKIEGNLFQKIIYQHLDAYVKDAAFQSRKWFAESLFLEN